MSRQRIGLPLSKDRYQLGKWGESIAMAWLLASGYEILSGRYRGRGFELDIVARRNNVLYAVEVKTRGEGSSLRIPWRKLKFIRRGLAKFVRSNSFIGNVELIFLLVKKERSGPQIELIGKFAA